MCLKYIPKWILRNFKRSNDGDDNDDDNDDDDWRIDNVSKIYTKVNTA
jgi:hypothetical protein